jgi:hypothetical protein
VGKVRVLKLAQILSTGSLDYIFDDSGQKKLPGRPVWAYTVGQGYATLGLYCHPMGGGEGGPDFFFYLVRTNIKNGRSEKKFLSFGAITVNTLGSRGRPNLLPSPRVNK